MKASQQKNSAFEWASVDPFLFGSSLNNVDLAFRGGVYAIRPSRSGVNPTTGFPTHGVYCIQDFEVLDGDFVGEIRKRSYYVGGLAGSIPKNSPPRPLLVPSVDNKTPVSNLSSEDIVALALGNATFSEEEYPDYEGKFLLQPKDHNMPLREDSQYGLLVNAVKGLYKVGKNGTPQEIAYGTTFPSILAGNTGPDFALNYGFHFRLEGDEFKVLVPVAALGLVEPKATQVATPAAVQSGTVATPVAAETVAASNGKYTVETARPLIYSALMKGPEVKNKLITDIMNSATGDKDSLVAVLLNGQTWESDLWELKADGKLALKQ